MTKLTFQQPANINILLDKWTDRQRERDTAGNTKGGSITVPLTSCLTGLDKSVLEINTKIVRSHTADSEPIKQEVNGTVIFLPLVFPGYRHTGGCKVDI